jgi:hypothetical protein
LLPAERAQALPDALPAGHWRRGDSFFHLVLRPLLPDEKGCADFK